MSGLIKINLSEIPLSMQETSQHKECLFVFREEKNMEPCGCHCETPTNLLAEPITTNVPATISQQGHLDYLEYGLIHCWDCEPHIGDFIGLWIIVFVFFVPYFAVKTLQSLRSDISCFDDKRYLSFAAIVSGRLLPKREPWKRTRTLLPITRAFVKSGAASARKTHLLQCAYCKDPPLRYRAEMDCPNCGAFHHSSCYWSHGGCSVYGCNSKTGKSGVSTAREV
jgi:hypothetical protein